MAKFFQQSSWLGIKFCDLHVRLDPYEPAGSEFYDAFYEKLFHTYPNFTSLPLDWRIGKEKDAEFLSRFIYRNANILSYGCGVGYLETCLMDILGQTFYVSDFSPYILKYFPELKDKFLEINSLDCFRFSQILLSQVTYSLNDIDLRALIRRLYDWLETDGMLIVSYSEERFNFQEFIKNIYAKCITSRHFDTLNPKVSNFINSGQTMSVQGWGYHRKRKEMIDIFTTNGFEVLRFSRFDSESFLFLRK